MSSCRWLSIRIVCTKVSQHVQVDSHSQNPGLCGLWDLLNSVALSCLLDSANYDMRLKTGLYIG